MGIPTGAAIAYMQLSVMGSPGDDIGPVDSRGVNYGTVRAQVSGIWSDTLGFAPLDTSLNIRIANFSGHTVSVYISVFGYS